ncbi:hypothetical protein FJ695_07775 [Labrenzia sp. PHM005]|nr:hypothetical protein FJ695_07775 [Labrenzia sp. PHM005]
MYVALGFCTAGLLCLAILPAFYRRAARLTEEALRAVNPSSYAEVRAAQDQVRAQHAVDLRRVERQLEVEREKAAERHIEVSRLKTEIDALGQAHQSELAGLKSEVDAKTNDENAIDLLSAEITALKKKLADAEQALAESWSENQSKKDASAADKKDDDWLPAADTMSLATITGLEAEVATLKAKLAKYEPSAAGELDNERAETARTKLAELEAQLVDTESKFITAQAEVTRLSLQLEASDIKESDLQKHLTSQLEALATENAKQITQLKAKEHTVQRLTGQIGKLQQDLAATPGLTQIRQDFRHLVTQLSGSAKKTAPAKPAPKAAASATRSDTPADMKPKKRVRRPSARTQPPQAETAPPAKPADPSSTADIASAAEALVSRIVASNRKSDGKTAQPEEQVENKTEVASADTPAVKGVKTRRKPRVTKQKNKDVA